MDREVKIMTKQEMQRQLFMDEITYIGNPYFYIRDYEDKGVYITIKKEKGADVSYLDLKEVCFECPNMESHKGILKMILFHINEKEEIYKYTIASSKEKVLRSDILKYEKYIGMKVE